MLRSSRLFGMRVLGPALAILLAGAGTAQAALIINFSQVGADVEASGTGNLNFFGLTFSDFYFGSSFVNSGSGAVLLGPVPPNFTDIFVGAITGPTSFGSGSNLLASSGASTAPSGTGAGINAALGEIYVPGGYVSGDPFTVDATWAGATFADLGLTSGTYTWTWGAGANADSLQVVIPGEVTEVPEPSSVLMLLAGLGLIGVASFLGRKKVLSI